MTSESRRNFLLASAPGAAALGMVAATPAQAALAEGVTAFDVTNFGAAGDGDTHCGEAFQRALDAAEDAGGGVVRIPPGTYLLDKTPFVGTRVHLMGSGPATVLRGLRPEGEEGAALISNKGQHAPRYEGAHDWSISHLAIDSPKTNGIVVTHAARVYLGFIHGIDAWHHFIDTVGRDILCENLHLTGKSGTSTFQIDSIHGAQTTWDGERAVAPLRDGTDTEDLILRSSIITATAGHTGSGPHHDCSIHFHGSEAKGFHFSDLILGGAETGFYQDPNTAYHGMQINNVRSYNPGRAIWFRNGNEGQRSLMIRGLQHAPEAAESYRGIDVDGRDGLIISDCQLEAPGACEAAIEIADSKRITIHGVQARGKGGTGIRLDGAEAEINACHLDGFDKKWGP